MALSRPIYSFLGSYLEQLFNHPVRTKSITSCVLATAANYTSQKISGQKKINHDSLVAYGLFGLIFGGTIPHYFYTTVERLFRKNKKLKRFLIFLVERLMYTPFYQVLSLYFLSRFEGCDHVHALKNLHKLYWPLLQANWKYLSAIVFLNIYFVPPMLRVLTANLIGFVWVIFIANKRRKFQSESSSTITRTNTTETN